MEQGQQATPEQAPGTGSVLGRIGRIIGFFLSAGFMYPNVWIEGLDLSKIQAATEGDLYKKKK